ncbi:hypothetical protein Hamer_G012523 [Homarus americanus]|uniref:Chitin-binding type-2 domain-containing protein n=2 Tax=Homarus americanus TaxID=6706 RepID=A0A8J5KJC5_HOMAM|nr:hypothetical protein Hamer_G012523 [Homarus americanus]
MPASSDTPLIVPASSYTPTVVPASSDTPTVVPASSDTPTVVPASSDTPTVVTPSSGTLTVSTSSNATNETSTADTPATLSETAIIMSNIGFTSEITTGISSTSSHTTSNSTSGKVTESSETSTDAAPDMTTEKKQHPDMTIETSTSGSVAGTASSVTPPLQESCNLPCTAPEMKVADPYNCHYFYACRFTEDLMPIPIRVKCPRRRPVFSAVSGTCVAEGPCVVRCQSSATIIIPPPQSTTTLSSISLSQHPTHPESVVTNTTVTTPTPTTPDINIMFNMTTTTATITSSVTTTTEFLYDCQPTCLVADSWLSDPTDCHYFYVCHFINDVISKPRRIKCPYHLPIFSQHLGRCTADAPCVTSCNHTTTVNIVTPVSSDSPICQPTCALANSRMSDPTDCHHYYICIILDSLIPQAVRTKCPQSRPYFDRRKGVCVPQSRCIITCTQQETVSTPTIMPPTPANVCHPVCIKPETVVTDPLDCHHYYICSASGALNSPTRMKCPSHLPIFDQDTNSCSKDAPCVVNCQANFTTTSALGVASVSNTITGSITTGNTTISSPITSVTTLAPTTNITASFITTIPSITTPAPISTTSNTLNTTNTSILIDEVTTNSSSSTLAVGIKPELCRPNCSSHNTVHHDPLDCHHYYVCMIVSGKPNLTKIQCPQHRPVFHLPTYSCQRSVPCIITCGDSVIFLPATIASTGTGAVTTESINPATITLGSTSPTTVNTSPIIVNTTPTTVNTTTTTVNTSPTTVNTSPITVNNTPVIISSTEETPGNNGVRCKPECAQAGILVADLTNCQRYYVCVYVDSLAPRPVRAACPQATPVFDTTKRRCVAEAQCYQPCAEQSTSLAPAAPIGSSTTSVTTTATPGSLCSAVCEAGDRVLPDPTDCHFYYLCSAIYGLPGALRVQCPPGRPVFDADQLVCSSSVLCDVPCPAAANPPPPPSTHSPFTSTLPFPPAGPPAPITFSPTHPPVPAHPPAPITSNLTQLSITPAPADSPSFDIPQECPHAGYFTRSKECSDTFIHCYQEGARLMSVSKRCPVDLVFNTVSTYPYCVPPTNCPYDPIINGTSVNATSCLHPGSFPKCLHCCPDFIRCEPSVYGPGYYPVAERCPRDLVFNTDPRYPVCIQQRDCPSGGLHTSQCVGKGNYPACPGCCKKYYHCTKDGRLQTRTCAFSLMFNPHPAHPYCVLAWNCPFVPAAYASLVTTPHLPVAVLP